MPMQQCNVISLEHKHCFSQCVSVCRGEGNTKHTDAAGFHCHSPIPCSHINRRTQFENPVQEAKRRLEQQQQMQDQGLSALPLPSIYRGTTIPPILHSTTTLLYSQGHSALFRDKDIYTIHTISALVTTLKNRIYHFNSSYDQQRHNMLRVGIMGWEGPALLHLLACLNKIYTYLSFIWPRPAPTERHINLR